MLFRSVVLKRPGNGGIVARFRFEVIGTLLVMPEKIGGGTAGTCADAGAHTASDAARTPATSACAALVARRVT